MQKPTTRQLHGTVRLVERAVDKSVSGIHTVQSTYAGYPYAVLRQVRPLSDTVRVVEEAQDLITNTVYWSIRTGNRLVWGLAAGALAMLDQTGAD